MISKYQHDLSDEAVGAGWVENPYWQPFRGRQYFEHEMPMDPSSMTRWRKRLGEAGAETMLKATIDTGVTMEEHRNHCEPCLDPSRRIHTQKRTDQEKIYSVHEPEVACIAQGKAGRNDELGQKVSVAVTSQGGWILGAQCAPGNPYDGHTLKTQKGTGGASLYQKRASQNGPHGHGLPGPRLRRAGRGVNGSARTRLNPKTNRALDETPRRRRTDHRTPQERLPTGVHPA